MDASLPRATILNTEVRNFPSAIMGRDYLISTWFPPDYPKPGHKYPVIYQLDAEFVLGMIVPMVFFLSAEQWIPDCIIVGVGHDVQTVDEWLKAREIDFLPETPDSTSPHRASDFLSFIQNELIPMVETTYPTDPTDRCLAGYSWGGVFSVYALLHEPDLFHRYLIGSAWGESFLPLYLAYEEQLAEKRNSLPVHIFFSVCSLEDDFMRFGRFLEAFKRRNFTGLRMDTMVIEGEKHSSGVPFAFSYGFKALYKP